MAKSISSRTIQVITYSTPLPAEDVFSLIDTEVARGPPITDWRRPPDITPEQFARRVDVSVGISGFRFYNWYDHGEWLQIYNKADDPACAARVYVLGNPLIARTLLSRDLRAGLNVPIRLFVMGKPDGKGTELIYQLPSSAIQGDEKMKAAAHVLDEKVAQLVRRVIQPSTKL
ncbi:DUF302 domain-containing protein [Mycena chlorophos]|uniref:DUF302 domain-containing protein n=1 Tax=Mycena chlorophos TaxID=658473 RepID=A0A8H6TBL5_MYCCL|nr:DUF302 domain-containing protein [Mycena chlorophos]